MGCWWWWWWGVFWAQSLHGVDEQRNHNRPHPLIYSRAIMHPFLWRCCTPSSWPVVPFPAPAICIYSRKNSFIYSKDSSTSAPALLHHPPFLVILFFFFCCRRRKDFFRFFLNTQTGRWWRRWRGGSNPTGWGWWAAFLCGLSEPKERVHKFQPTQFLP